MLSPSGVRLNGFMPHESDAEHHEGSQVDEVAEGDPEEQSESEGVSEGVNDHGTE